MTKEEVLKLADQAGAEAGITSDLDGNDFESMTFSHEALGRFAALLAAQPEQPIAYRFKDMAGNVHYAETVPGFAQSEITPLCRCNAPRAIATFTRAGERIDADLAYAIKSRKELEQAQQKFVQPSSGAVDERLNSLITDVCNTHFMLGDFDTDFGDDERYEELSAAADRAIQSLRDYLSAPTAAPALTDELIWAAAEATAESTNGGWRFKDGFQLKMFAHLISASPQASQLEQRIAELEAARRAYASEFPPDAEGEPDVGTIHANIRKLKAQASQSSQQEREAANYRWLRDEYKLCWYQHCLQPSFFGIPINSASELDMAIAAASTVKRKECQVVPSVSEVHAAIAARAQEKANG